jgi:TolB-like protein
LKRIVISILIIGFSTFVYAKGSSEGELDRAIDTQGNYLLNQIPQNSIIAIIGISSGSEDLSKYITESLTSYMIYNSVSNIKVVERVAMPILQKEINFQYSGAVDDEFMVSLGKMVGANTVIAGTIYSIGKDLRFNIRAIEIETSYIIASNGVDFRADKKIKTFLYDGTVEKTLSRDNIPIRQNDGSISKENRELLENQKRAISNTFNFFSKNFFNREPRWLLGYNFFPDFPLSIETGYIRNGLGFYVGIGADPRNLDNNYSFSYIGESVGVFNMPFGITYPLYFNWLWLAGGGEICIVSIATERVNYSWANYLSDQKMVFNPSIGIYMGFKRLYVTAKYRYLFYGNSPHNFMLGIGVGL